MHNVAAGTACSLPRLRGRGGEWVGSEAPCHTCPLPIPPPPAGEGARWHSPSQFSDMALAEALMSSREHSGSFVERHGLWSADQTPAAGEVVKAIAQNNLEVVRFSFVDQHGVLRGKAVMASEAAQVMRNGCAMTTTLLAKDTAHRTAYPVFTAGGGFGMAEMEGGGGFLMIAEPTAVRVLPWGHPAGWAP